jgi:CubicO group peptidase (beta-lactamase class C family)
MSKMLLSGLIVATLALTPVLAVSKTIDDNLKVSPIKSAATTSPLTWSAILRPYQGVDVVYDVGVTEQKFFEKTTGTFDSRAANGFAMSDIDIVVEPSSGERKYSAVFEKLGAAGVANTELWVLPLQDFKDKVVQRSAADYRLIDIETYLEGSQRYFVGIFRKGGAQQDVDEAMTWSMFHTRQTANKNGGLVLTHIKPYVEGGQERVFALWEVSSDARNASWVGDWNSLAKANFHYAASGLRMVDLESFESNGQRHYAAVWLPGSGAYDLVAANDGHVLALKVSGSGAAKLVPAVIQAERGYMPPAGMAAAFHDYLDNIGVVGYSYSLTENRLLTARGGFGQARSSSEPVNPGLNMTASSRQDLASVTKMVTAVAVMKLISESSKVKLDTPFMDIIGKNFSTVGSGVKLVTIRDLLQHTSGLYEKDCSDPAASIKMPATDTKEYRTINYCLLRSVVEEASGQLFEKYLAAKVFSPMGILNVNCDPNYGTPSQTLYYKAGDPNNGWLGNDRARSLLVCGGGGLQANASQMNLFLQRLVENRVLLPGDLTQMQNEGMGMYKFSTVLGNGHTHNGAFENGNNQGATNIIAMLDSDKQFALLTNSQVDGDVDVDSVLRESINRMNAMPIGTVRIVNDHYAWCMTLQFGSSQDFTNILLQQCDGTSKQKFILRPIVVDGLGPTGENLLEMYDTGKCVDINQGSTAANANAIQYSCHGDVNERFYLDAAPGFGDLKLIKNAKSGLCLSSGSNAVMVVQVACAPNDGKQRFQIQLQ